MEFTLELHALSNDVLIILKVGNLSKVPENLIRLLLETSMVGRYPQNKIIDAIGRPKFHRELRPGQTFCCASHAPELVGDVTSGHGFAVFFCVIVSIWRRRFFIGITKSGKLGL